LGKIVGEIARSTSILSRFLRHAEMFAITGKSYQLLQQAAGANVAGLDGESRTAKAPISPAGRNRTAAAL
jgi:hypothetical protein